MYDQLSILKVIHYWKLLIQGSIFKKKESPGYDTEMSEVFGSY